MKIKAAKIRGITGDDDDEEDDDDDDEGGLEGQDGPADDVHTLSDLILLYSEGRG